MKIDLRFPTIAITLLRVGLAQSTDEPTRQIAIIGTHWTFSLHLSLNHCFCRVSPASSLYFTNCRPGAGAAGSSAAHFLQQFADEAGVHVNITLFEKTDRIGGRTRTINPFDDPAQRVEQGASIFVQANNILYNAMTEFELPPRVQDADADPVMGIWDGDRFAFTLDQSAPSWYNTLKVIWHYGVTAPQRAQQLTATTIAKFLRLYEAPFFPFPSLTQRAQELELVEATGVTGEQFLKSNNVSSSENQDPSAADSTGRRPLFA